MNQRKRESRVNFIVGVFVLVLSTLLIVSLFIIATSEGLLKPHTTITSDFRTITGLNDSSKVQLAGREIGKVIDFAFTERQYQCYPESEDNGREVDGRTDDCEPSLFCAKMEQGGACGELERYAGNSNLYEPCVNNDSCPEDKICLTKKFRERYPRNVWSGNEGLCVGYSVVHRRVTVTMEIDLEKLPYIRTDSRATIQSNGVLGDKLVDITVGTADQIEVGGRILANPSLMEEIELFKEQLYSITGKVDSSLAGVSGLFDALNNDGTKRDLRGLLENANEISRQVKEGEGLVGALFNSNEYRDEFGQTLRSLRHSSSALDESVSAITKELPPAVNAAARAANSAAQLFENVQDPNNRSVVGRVFHDPELGGEFHEAVRKANDAITSAQQAASTIQNLADEVNRSVASGEGTLGKLIKDPKAYDDLVKLLGNIERINVVKRLVRFVLEKEEAASSARPSSKTTGSKSKK